jgi:hypothetical protein
VASFTGIEPEEVPAMATRSSAQIPRAAARLREISDRLRAMQSSVAVAVAALRSQNADIDEDVARLLVRTVSDPLQDQIDSIKSVLRLLAHSARDKR